MKNFNVKKGNFIKSNNNTTKMMYHVIICLIPIILFSFYKNGILPVIKGSGSVISVLRPLFLIIVPCFVSILTEYIYYIIKKDKKDLNYLFLESFAIIPGMFIGLIIPINTPMWLVIIAAFIASFSKMICGGLGKNIFNPALFGALIITVFAASYIGGMGGYLNSYEIDAISSATPLSNLSALGHAGSYNELITPYGSLWTFFFGNIPGAIGETSSFLCIMAFIYLVINKVIKWRISVSYVLTVFVISLIIGFANNMGLWYPVFCILSGGLLFGAVFMATDPVTSPITNHGQVLGGIILGIITIIIRYLTVFPEGVLISILIFNILTLGINYLSNRFSFNKLYKIISLLVVIIIGIILTIIISNKIDYNPNSIKDDTFTVTDTEIVGNSKIYYVTSQGFGGKKSIKSKITMENNNIVKFEIISSKDSYMGMVLDNNYIDTIINNQNNLDNIDGVSGATYTSKYLKELTQKIKLYDRSN